MNTGKTQVLCTQCYDPFSVERFRLGYTTCLACGDTAARKASLKNTTPIPKPTAPMAAMANVTCSPISEHRRVVLVKDLHAVPSGDLHGVIDNGRVNGGKGRALGVRVAHLQ